MEPEPVKSADPNILRHVLIFFALAVVCQNLDLITKREAFQRLGRWSAEDGILLPYETVDAIDGILQFELTYNKGSIFGLGQEWGWVFLVFSVLAAPMIVVIFLRTEPPRRLMTISLGLILAGALGNLYDRLTIGMVRDFIKVHPDLFSYPIFNLADSFICVGVSLIVLEGLILGVIEKRKRKQESSSAA